MAFCPNCGNREADGVAACSKCNTPIGGAAAAPTKFKGTMMMGGASSAEVEAMVQKAKAAALAGQAARAATAAPAMPAPAASSPPAEDALAFQATIMGPITTPDGEPAAFPHPFGEGPSEPGEDAIHSAATMAFDRGPDLPAPHVDEDLDRATAEPAPRASASSSTGMGAGAFSDDRMSAPIKKSGGGAGKVILILVLLLAVLGGVATALYFAFRTPEVPAYPGYPMPGQPGVPGQYPGYPVPGQMPVPGQFPQPPAAPAPTQ